MNKAKVVLVCLFVNKGSRYDDIILIRKNSPEWQKDKLNLIGGEFEEKLDKDTYDTAVREVEEETGLIIDRALVKKVGSLKLFPVTIDVFAFLLDEKEIESIKEKTDKGELIVILPISTALNNSQLLNDLRYIITGSMKVLDNWNPVDSFSVLGGMFGGDISKYAH